MTPGRKGRVQQSDCWGQGEVGGGIGEEEAHRRRRERRRMYTEYSGYLIPTYGTYTL